MLIALPGIACLILVLLLLVQQRKIRALRQDKQSFSTLAENSPDLVFRYDRNCRRLYVNPAVVRLFRKPVEEILGRTPTESPFLDPEQNRKMRDGIRSVFETNKTCMVEVVYVAADGLPHNYSMLLIPEHDAQGQVETVLGLNRDITAIQEAERTVSNLVAQLPGFVFKFRMSADGSMSCPFTSPRMEEFFGLRSVDIADDATPLYAMTHPEDAPRVLQAIHESARTMSHLDVEYRLLRPGYPERWMQLIANPEQQADGVVLWYGIFLDITERKHAEQDLKQALESIDGIINAIPDLLFEVDLNGTYLNVWASDPTLLATQEEALLNHTIRDVLLPDAAEVAMSAIEEADRTGSSFGKVMRVELPKGESWFELSVSRKPGSSQTDRRFIALSREVTERKRLQEKVAESQNFLDRIINATIDPIFVKDRQHRWILANDALCDLLGSTREELIGKSDFEFLPEAEARYFWEGDEVVFTEGGDFSREEEITVQGGEKRYIFTRKRLFNDVHGKPNLTGVITDITERKRMELQLAARERELRSLMENLPANIARYTPDAHIIYVNPTLERTTDTPKECFLDKTPMETFPDGRYSEYQRQILDTAASGVGTEMEIAVPVVDGEEEVHLLKFVAERDEKGVVSSVLVIGTDITERKRAELALAVRERELRTLLENTPDNIIRYTPDARHLYSNPVTERTTGKLNEHLRGKTATERLPNGQHAEIKRRVIATATSGENDEMEMVVPLGNGEEEVHLVRFIPECDEKGAVVSVLVIGTDFTERKRAEEKLRLAASVFTNSNDGIVVTDVDNRILDINAAFTRITGYSREEVIGKNPNVLRSERQDSEFYAELWRTLEQTDHWVGEIWNKNKSGEVYAEWLTISVVRDEQGKISHYVGVFSDISLLKKHEQQLQRIAHHDILTGLPNRLLFMDRLNQAMAQAQRTSGLLAVCYGDLDGFKPVNDRFGHEAGDHVLITIGRRMQECVRAVDTVGRIGGDEFVLLLNVNNVQDCEMIMARLLNAVAQPIRFNGHSVSVTASLGIVFFPQDETNPDTLLRHADQAMYQAKRSGKNIYRFFNPSQA